LLQCFVVNPGVREVARRAHSNSRIAKCHL
jgi:hypothetical protein